MAYVQVWLFACWLMRFVNDFISVLTLPLPYRWWTMSFSLTFAPSSPSMHACCCIFSPSVTSNKLSMCGDDILDWACKALIACLFLHLGETDEGHLNGWINNAGLCALIQEFIWWKRPIFAQRITDFLFLLKILTLETADETYLILSETRWIIHWMT